MCCRLRLQLTVCSYPKVAILPLNFILRTAFQIYDKLLYEERTRHFWVGAVSGSLFFFSMLSAVNCVTVGKKKLSSHIEVLFGIS